MYRREDVGDLLKIELINEKILWLTLLFNSKVQVEMVKKISF